MAANEAQMGKVRKIEVWVGGRWEQAVNSITPSVNKNERSYDRFGLDDNLQDVEVQDGGFTLRALTTSGGVSVQHALLGLNPDAPVSGLAIEAGKELAVPVILNHRNADDTAYEKGHFLDMWAPTVLPDEQGQANDTSLPEFSGKTGKRREISDGFFYTHKVAKTGTGPYTATVSTGSFVPYNGKGCLALLAISGTGNGPLKWAKINGGENFLNASTGAISVSAADYAASVPSGWGGFTSFLAVLAMTGTGTKFGNDLPVTGSTMWS